MFTFSNQIGSVFLYHIFLFIFMLLFKKTHNKMLSLASGKDLGSKRCTSCFKSNKTQTGMLVIPMTTLQF